MINRCGKLMAGLILAAMLASLGACAGGTSPPPNGTDAAPGSFHVHLNGEMVNMIGAAQR